MFEEIRKLIERYDTIILHRHLKPDGDALGSQIGLKHLILDNYPGKQVYMVGDEAGRYAFMACWIPPRHTLSAIRATPWLRLPRASTTIFSWEKCAMWK